MKRWFDNLPVHRKLVAMAVLVSSTAMLIAATGLMILDVVRYRASAQDDAITFARIIAENTAAAVTFRDPADASETLASVRVRDAVTRACIYLEDGRLFVGYERSPDLTCPPTVPLEPAEGSVQAAVPIVRNNRTWGLVHVERDLSDLGARIAVTAASAAAMLVFAGILAFAIAQRLNRTISRPIAELASAASKVGREAQYEVPQIEAPHNEIGALVHSFQNMVARVRDANEGLLREIDERRRIEAERERLLIREREANRLKDEFLAAVSHELRTPLNAILGWVQILGSTKPDEKTMAKAVSVITRNVHAQTRVIEDLVDVSRIVTGKLPLQLEALDLQLPVEAALEVVRPQGDSKGITIDLHHADRPCIVTGDRDRLQQIVWNLLSNAIKFSDPGGRITVTTRAGESWHEIEVRDEGAGIPPEFLPYVFDRFRQADGSMSREHGGLGLGLAIVRDLTEMHGGTVHVASAGKGTGATFSVRIPARAGAIPDAQAATAGNNPELRGVTVLAVDDNPDALEVVAMTLRSAGASVRTATSGAEAIAAWRREPADILLCDLAMPETDGFAVLRQIREYDATRGRTTRAIAVSAHASDDHRRKTNDAGFAHHLAKPYQTNDLLRAVSSVLAVSF
jgi:signal transduction histidine kinase/CheY-like chemotaxis protein